MNRKQFQRIVQKNIIYFFLPRFIMLIGLFLISFEMLQLDKFKVYNDKEAKDAVKLYEAGLSNFVINVDELFYTGFDYKVGKKIKGSYFYTIEDNTMYLFLLDNKTSDDIKSSKKENYILKCRIVEDESTANYVASEYAASLDVNYDDMTDYCCKYILSELQYPASMIFLVKLFNYISLAFVIILILFTAIIYNKVWLYPEIRKIKKYGNVKAVVEDLDEQMENNILYSQDNVFVTEKYLIVGYVSRIDVVLLDDVEYLSKHVEQKKSLFGKTTKVYRLTASNPDKLYFECDFADEDVINDVIYYIRGDDDLDEIPNT